MHLWIKRSFSYVWLQYMEHIVIMLAIYLSEISGWLRVSWRGIGRELVGGGATQATKELIWSSGKFEDFYSCKFHVSGGNSELLLKQGIKKVLVLMPLKLSREQKIILMILRKLGEQIFYVFNLISMKRPTFVNSCFLK